MTMYNPPHPGEFIWATSLEPFDISIRSLAASLGVAPSTPTRLINMRSGISSEMALRLSKALDAPRRAGWLCSTTMICGKPEKP